MKKSPSKAVLSRAAAISAALLASIALPARAEDAAAASRPDIVLVVIDSLRADHMGCHGYGRDTTPYLDAFARESVRFDQVVASGPWTLPAIMSIFTAVPPEIHGCHHWTKPYSTNVVTVAEALKAAGYQTVGITANPTTHRRNGFARGFDHYDDYTVSLPPGAPGSDAASQAATGATMTRLAQNWLFNRRDPSKPLFLFVLYMDPHWDYIPPAPYDMMFTDGDPIPAPRDIWKMGGRAIPEAARRRVAAAYDGEIRYTDTCVSNLIESIKKSPRAPDTLIAICSDHGEAFWERGFAAHGNNLHEEEIRVPLIISPPSSSAPASGGGLAVATQVGTMDLAPTFLDFAGIAPPSEWTGASLRPLVMGEDAPERPVALDLRIAPGGDLRGVRTSKFKLMAKPPFNVPFAVYDLAADPGETNNLVAAGAALPDAALALVPLLEPARGLKGGGDGSR